MRYVVGVMYDPSGVYWLNSALILSLTVISGASLMAGKTSKYSKTQLTCDTDWMTLIK